MNPREPAHALPAESTAPECVLLLGTWDPCAAAGWMLTRTLLLLTSRLTLKERQESAHGVLNIPSVPPRHQSQPRCDHSPPQTIPLSKCCDCFTTVVCSLGSPQSQGDFPRTKYLKARTTTTICHYCLLRAE